RRAVERATVLGWLEREHALLRRLFAALDFAGRDAFERFAAIYSAWATAQARAQWLDGDDAAIAARLQPFARAPLAQCIGPLRRNRAEFVGALHELDLRREEGNLLLSPAGMVHAIFGLSHQTHPLDGTRAAR